MEKKSTTQKRGSPKAANSKTPNSKRAFSALALLIIIILGGSAQAQNFTEAQGGNITEYTFFVNTTPTRHWSGVVGRVSFNSKNLSTSSVYNNDTNVSSATIYLANPCKYGVSVTGHILFSNSSKAPISLIAGNISLLDDFLKAPVDERAADTFTTNTTFQVADITIPSTPTTYTLIPDSGPSPFKVGYLNDGFRNFVFAAEATTSATGFNGSSYSFQVILPTKNMTPVQFYLTAPLNLICAPAPSFGSGSSSPKGCFWDCDKWNECENGVQNRTCEPYNCGSSKTSPPTVQACLGEEGGASTFTRRQVVTGLRDQLPLGLEVQTLSTLRQDISTFSIWQEIKKGVLFIPKKIISFFRGLFGGGVSGAASAELDINTEFSLDAGASGWELQANISIYNPNNDSIENLSVSVELPTLYEQYMPLHYKPRMYGLFGVVPATTLEPEVSMLSNTTEFFRLDPAQGKNFTLSFQSPLVTPRTLVGMVQVRSGDVSLVSKEVELLFEADPFIVAKRTLNKNTVLEILIDNRNQNSRKAQIELNFNKAKSTLFSDLIDIELPIDEVVLLGYAYRVDEDYDTIRVRFEDSLVEV